MLNILIEDFEKNFFRDDDKAVIDRCLYDEFKCLSDFEHLENNVINKADFQWDYNAIGEGFIELVTPFMKKQSYIANLFLHALRDLDNYRPEYIKAIIILEYTHYASLINDFYNFHEEFTKVNQDPRKCSKLTQLRYAAQYLNNYPRYLLIKNKFGVDDETIFNLHRWILNNHIILGISRGLFVKWSHSYFNNLTVDNYFQNSINGLCIDILYPVIMASIFSKVPSDKMHSLKKAFSYLTLVTKLRCEKRVYLNSFDGEVEEQREGALLPIRFQGFAFITKGLKVDPSRFSEVRFPNIRDLHEEISQPISKENDPKLVQEIEDLEKKYFDLFLSEIEKVNMLNNTAALFEKCFKIQ
jgi:hypothetical protein